jgi:hypothetical protein
MPETTSDSQASMTRLILVPAVITLAITILRLVGELRHWSPLFFNTNPGGAGALVGIVWLVPILGIYFAMRLSRAGQGAPSRWRPLGFALLGLLLMVAGGVVFASAEQSQSPGKFLLAYLILIGSAFVPFSAWPALGKVLVAYGYAARLPVAIIMFFAIRGGWGTHYDAPPPGLPPMGFWMKYLMIGLLPQLVLWITFTVIVGVLFGGIVNALAARSKSVPVTT